MLTSFVPHSGELLIADGILEGIAEGPVMAAAILYKGQVWYKAAPARHSDIINEMFTTLGGVVDAPQVDGFVTLSGHFVDRQEGLKAARAAGQFFLEEPRSAELFSENLW